MKSALVVLAVVASTVSAQDVGKSTYAMSHPFAWKAFMEKYFPVQENLVQENSTTTCVEWVKLCMDSGAGQACGVGDGPGSHQMHSVGAYKRDSGKLSMQQIELAYTQALGDMSKYDPFSEMHVGLLAKSLLSYEAAFYAAGIKVFKSSFVDETTKITYNSLLVQTEGSLEPGAGSLLSIEILAAQAEGAEGDGSRYKHVLPRSSPGALARGAARLASAERQAEVGTPEYVTTLHVSFATSNVTRDAAYFESVLGGTKTYAGSTDTLQVYMGNVLRSDTVEIRFAQSSAQTQGPMSVLAWEQYQTSLHNKCFVSATNEGFDRLADNHFGQSMPGNPIDAIVKAHKAAGLPYRFYSPPGPDGSKGGDAAVDQPGGTTHFFYAYMPNGWGAQFSGSCTDSTLCPTGVFYDMCTQGVTGSCNHDLPSFAQV